MYKFGWFWWGGVKCGTELLVVVSNGFSVAMGGATGI